MRIEPSGLKRVVTCAPVFFQSQEDQKLCTRIGLNTAVPAEFTDDLCSTSSSSTSSIGRNSDLSSERSTVDEDCGENEAQSAYNEPLDMMESLEEMLPIRRGISKFYNGKSKSFTSLAEASFSASVKDITKPENAYTRRRKNLMAFNHVWDKDKNRSFPLRSNGGGISKRSISNSRSTLALAVAMNNCDSSSCTSEDSNSRSPPPLLPPLHPRSRIPTSTRASASPSIVQNFSASRSFSLADLHHCATAAKMDMPSSTLGNETALAKLI